MSRVKCFAEEAARIGAYRTLDAGPRVIEVVRITGTVDKCGELDGRFRLLGRRHDRRERFRRRSLEQANLAITNLPPIAAYLLSGEYYVIDGNRRVAAALQQGLEYLDAHVTECIPLADRAALEGASSRRRFEQETGLKSVRLAYERGYATLLEEVAAYQSVGEAELAARERARRWLSGFFRPACALLRSSALARRFRVQLRRTGSFRAAAARRPLPLAAEAAGRQSMIDRLEHIRNRLKRSKVYYSRYNPSADLLYEVEDAEEDVRWMLYEIERLRALAPDREP